MSLLLTRGFSLEAGQAQGLQAWEVQPNTSVFGDILSESGEGGSEGGDVCILRADSCDCMAETNTTW